jgi:hypothetical protein
VNVSVLNYEYGIQNMDETAKCDRNSLTAIYDGVAISFMFDDDCRLLFEIENKTNKSLILDKSKSFVLYNGYSYELFKDVRTGKVTTFNDVQDAVSSVQTNESSVTMSIPPYSKWRLPVVETNIKKSKYPTFVKYETGSYPQSVYSSEYTIEFVIPYSFDYKLAKWNTSRNRIYFDNLQVEKHPMRTSNGYFSRRYADKTRLVYMYLTEEDAQPWRDVWEYNFSGRFQRR